MSKLVTIYGGSGFVGRYIARRMAREGWRVRVACRRPNEAIFVRPYGVVGQVEPVFCNIRDDDSVRSVMQGADAVVNCVGTFDKGGKNNFDAVQHEGAERIARIAAEEGVSRMVHVSAIGADPKGKSLYAKSKGKGEEAVLEHMPQAVILRPSVIFGPEDAFFNRFASMTRMGPVLPIVGGATKFQPVYVDDVAQAAVKGVLGQAVPGIYELGGPDVMTFRELMQVMLDVIRRRRFVANIPFFCRKCHCGGFGSRAKPLAGPDSRADHRRPGPQPAPGQRHRRRRSGVLRPGDLADVRSGGAAGLSLAVPAFGPIRGDQGIGPEPAVAMTEKMGAETPPAFILARVSLSRR